MRSGQRRKGRILRAVLGLFVLLTFGMVGMVFAVVTAAARCEPAHLAPTRLAEDEVPADYLALYQRHGAEAGVPWSVLAAVGWVETRHGTLRAPGATSGTNHAGAAGPMQFGIDGRAGNTWGGDPVRTVPPHLAYGVDGDGDGIADVYNPADAIPAAAGYLAAHGAPEDLRGALFAYNRADWYVERVLAKAAEYGEGGVVAVGSVALTGPGIGCDNGYAAASNPSSGAGPWGDHANGRIPLDELCEIGGGHRLRCDAADAFRQMDAAHSAALGRPIAVTDSYRSYAGQVNVHRRKPHLAATPGTSNHGWGLAVDLDVGGWDGVTFRWLQANAHHYGWHHPRWAHSDGSKPEPWHWEYEG